MDNANESDENVETIMEVDEFDDNEDTYYENMSECSLQSENYQYAVDEESMVIVEEDDISSHSSSNSELLEIEDRPSVSSVKNSSDFNPIMCDSTAVNFNSSGMHIVTKKIMPYTSVSDIPTCSTMSYDKSGSLDLEKIAVPKKTDVSNIKFNSRSTSSSKFNNTPLISFVSAPCVPKSTTMPRLLKPKLELESNSNKYFTKTTQELKKISSNDSKTEMYVVPHNGVNYMIRKVEKNKLGQTISPSIKTSFSTLKNVNKSLQSTVNATNQKRKLIINTSNSQIDKKKFVARMEKLPDGKYKMVPAQGNIPGNLENLFKRNSNFVKQKIAQSTAASELKVGGFVQMNQTTMNSMNLKPDTNIRPYRKHQQSGTSWVNVSQSNDDIEIECLDEETSLPTTSSNDFSSNDSENNPVQDVKDVCLPGFIRISPNSLDTKVPLDSHSLSIAKYGKVANKKQVNQIGLKVLSVESLSKTKPNLTVRNSNEIACSSAAKVEYQVIENACENNDFANRGVQSLLNDESRSSFGSRNVRKPNKNVSSNENNKPLREPPISSTTENNRLVEKTNSLEEDNDKMGQFVSCHYEYCDTLVHEPELIDKLYCSLACKQMDSKGVVAIEEPINEPEEVSIPIAPKKPIIDRQQLLAKLGNRIHKRKQQLTAPCPDKKGLNDSWDEPLFDSSGSIPPNDGLSSPLNSPPTETCHEMNNDEEDDVYDDEDDDDIDDGNLVFDLESVKGNQKLLNYMEEMLLTSAPKSLFNKPFPLEQNFFKVGQKLEGIDPEHEALFCVMTIVEVQGYRIKLHFDGYADEYDFWVNADCPDIFYARWCEQNSRIVQPPKNYVKRFDWGSYLRECRAVPAPKWCFSSIKKSTNSQIKLFKIGAKLEALDKLTRTLPKQLICVATVADILGDRLRIHFDGWTDDFDYWTDVTSTNIHPIRWCDNNGRVLSPPSGYNDFKGKKPFSWTEYLMETKSEPVPEEAFVRRPLRDFSINMTIEVVDLVVPSLIRTAKVIDVKGDEIKILYDGFRIAYAYWVEDDSPDIHPVGWAVRTNHPLEIPPVENKIQINGTDLCRTVGCSGKGHANSLKANHSLAKDCPYELDLWKKAVAGLAKIPDRIKTEDAKKCTISSKSHFQHVEEKKKPKYSNFNENVFKQKNKNSQNKRNAEHKNISVKQNTVNVNNLELRQEVGLSVITNDVGPLSASMRGRAWTRHNAQLGIPMFSTTDARKWSVEEVASYVDRVVATKYVDQSTDDKFTVSEKFVKQKIDGRALLVMGQDELMNILNIPLGPAIKLSSAIVMLRQRIPAFDV
ncbi:uncharacterized protein LOC126842792 [Adelges cooleyi]|uniref:uncharacterized protein LOC126842792 n=1 Tax=Adelges cooleyi TaxID=133065 RepID=UPI0021808B91|nr:uncharacterized protein LOC126842792 [Adelges cooleyi]XP_050435904.1 uncharacterized protein LOC126842792 [Adelges cooleyi]XP_050435905.1 uncharacterized protein LOC126842792 [Adelges cooleyi]